MFHRNNLSIRTAEVHRNFGNATTWEKTFEDHFRNFIKEINGYIFDSGVRCYASNQSVFDIVNVDYDLVYLDPPYLNQDGTNETSNYLKCYHFLEGLASFDEWPAMIDYDSINLRFRNINEYNHFKKETIYDTFDSLFKKFSKSIIVLSYKQGGTPSIETLMKIMKRYKNHVYTKSVPYAYALNGNNKNKRSREVIIIGK
ncbi:MAG: DNA adenine methylase [Bacteroidetes bacterium]|nr:DNA adenine methylase [Bacteroidota bacterium]